MANSVSKSYKSLGTRNEISFIFRNVLGKHKIQKGASNFIQAVFKACLKLRKMSE